MNQRVATEMRNIWLLLSFLGTLLLVRGNDYNGIRNREDTIPRNRPIEIGPHNLRLRSSPILHLADTNDILPPAEVTRNFLLCGIM